MKLKICIYTILLMLLCCVNVSGAEVFFGDVDGDKAITANDATIVLQYTLNNSISIPFMENADVDSDGYITATDSACILQKVLISTYLMPVEDKKPSGQGAEENPYKITSAEELEYIFVENDKYYQLMNDIDLSGISWTPQEFKGYFDGQGYSIKSLKVSDDSQSSGLISVLSCDVINTDTLSYGYYVGGRVSNVNVEIKDSGKNAINSGGIAGEMYACSEIKGCSVTGIISSQESAGGIVGKCQAGTVIDCISEANVYVSGDTMSVAGGIVGVLYEGYNNLVPQVIRCRANGVVSSSSTDENNVFAGEISGYTYGAGIIEDCTSNVDIFLNGVQQ